MIDSEGYRQNVGIVICNPAGQLLWAKRCGQHAWQFPQGGINVGESTEQAMYRELYEEVGLGPKAVRLLSITRHWLHYQIPKRLIRWHSKPLCIGQKQKWFLLCLQGDEQCVNIRATDTPEFDDWRWVSYWYPVRQAVSFKRNVYRQVLQEFAGIVMPAAEGTPLSRVRPFKSKPTNRDHSNATSHTH
ncbi:RNA pyrophosphohydrolase [unidentified bacterial endosymbiont]|uniref:RNA pyrophosphohydrolase n=1 Tax=unidentified bacterial endosymbiont TaxID=2355 RepID=UPI0020A1F23B|nr:RNA pyrophosphohydrolase [unidentified bacterial endosymbiont]